MRQACAYCPNPFPVWVQNRLMEYASKKGVDTPQGEKYATAPRKRGSLAKQEIADV